MRKKVVKSKRRSPFKKSGAREETPLEFFSRFKGLGCVLERRKDLPRKIDFSCE